MKKIQSFKIFKESLNSTRLLDPVKAREALSKIYDIQEEVGDGALTDFLVPIDNYFQVLIDNNANLINSKVKDLLVYKQYLMNKLSSVSKHVYVAVPWFTKDEKQLSEFNLAFFKNLYVEILDRNFSIEQQDAVMDSLDADEVRIMRGKSGKVYLQLYFGL